MAEQKFVVLLRSVKTKQLDRVVGPFTESEARLFASHSTPVVAASLRPGAPPLTAQPAQMEARVMPVESR